MSEEAPLTPLKAIRSKCLDCCCDSPKEVKLCHIKDCALHPYRLGRNPRLRAAYLAREEKKATRSTEK